VIKIANFGDIIGSMLLPFILIEKCIVLQRFYVLNRIIRKKNMKEKKKKIN